MRDLRTTPRWLDLLGADSDSQSFCRSRFWPLDPLPFVRFRYLTDPLFLVCCALYALNRWALKPRIDSVYLRFWFNDLLLVPCAIPVVFWIFRQSRFRHDDAPPSALDLCWILTLWSLLFEWIGPSYLRRGVADSYDVLMYWIGGIFAWWFWNKVPRRVVLS